MLDDRKATILSAVVEEYIATAQPVGSGRIAVSPRVDVSSATIRNEMVALEEAGYLAQTPHQCRSHTHRQGIPVLRRSSP